MYANTAVRHATFGAVFVMVIQLLSKHMNQVTLKKLMKKQSRLSGPATCLIGRHYSQQICLVKMEWFYFTMFFLPYKSK